MKRYLYCLILTIFSFNQILHGQNGDPPEPGGSPVEHESPVGGGAPVGSGVLLLISSALGYGVVKFAKRRMLENTFNK